MKKVSLLALVLCMSVFPLYAQFEVLTDVGNPGSPLKANTYPEVKGTAYIVDFEPGLVIYTKKDTLKNISIRFNAYGNMLEYKNQGVLRGLSTKDILGFALMSNGRPQYFTHGYDLPNLGKDIFVQVLADGKYTLLNYRYKIMADDPAAAYGSQRSKMFQDKNDFFIASEKGVVPLKTKKKQFIELFGEDAAEVNKILNANYYDLKNEADLTRLVKLINSL